MEPTDPERDETFRLDDGRSIGFRQFGCREGFPVLALHGTPGSRLKYRVAHDIALRRGLRLVSADRWGYGLTTVHPAPSLAAFADDYAALMAHYGYTSTLPSWGYPAADHSRQRWRHCRPENVARLALVAPVGEVSAPESSSRMGWFHRFCFRTLPKIPGAVRAAFEVFRLHCVHCAGRCRARCNNARRECGSERDALDREEAAAGACIQGGPCGPEPRDP